MLFLVLLGWWPLIAGQAPQPPSPPAKTHAQTVSQTKRGEPELHPWTRAVRDLIAYPEYQAFLKTKWGPDFSLEAQVARWKTTHPEVTATQLMLALGVLDQGGKSVLGVMNPVLCEKASIHAKDMVKRYKQDHANWGTRAQGLGEASEIVKETFDGVNSIVEAGRFCANWTSGTHRPDMMGKHKSFCYDMAQAADGKWFCVGIFSETI